MNNFNNNINIINNNKINMGDISNMFIQSFNENSNNCLQFGYYQ